MAAGRPGDAFAIGNDEQYRPVRVVGDQRVPVGGPEGTGWLACHASRSLREPRRGPVVIVVHGALRDSDRYLASAQHAARLACSDALIVGNSAGGQFVNRYAAVGRGPDALAARGLRVRFVVANPRRTCTSAGSGPSRCRAARRSTTGATGSTAPPATWTQTRGGA